jgi:hypothetical protein
MLSIGYGQSIKQITSGLDAGKSSADDFADGDASVGWRACSSPREDNSRHAPPSSDNDFSCEGAAGDN